MSSPPHDLSCPECGGNNHIGGDTDSPWACTRLMAAKRRQDYEDRVAQTYARVRAFARGGPKPWSAAGEMRADLQTLLTAREQDLRSAAAVVHEVIMSARESGETDLRSVAHNVGAALDKLAEESRP